MSEPASATSFCQCEWPEASRYDVNRCLWCSRYIPVQPTDMTLKQRACRAKFEKLRVPWPKSESGR
jgi:hypothetical protein